MGDAFEICSLIEKGGVFTDVEGQNSEEVYKNLTEQLNLPAYLNKKDLADELQARENVLSTAVGNGIAIPHPRRPMLESEADQRIFVCFPKSPLDMNGPDNKNVYVMFVILSNSSKAHLAVLSGLAKAIKSTEFQHFLQGKPSKDELVAAFKRYSE